MTSGTNKNDGSQPVNPYAAAGSPGSVEAAEIDAMIARDEAANTSTPAATEKDSTVKPTDARSSNTQTPVRRHSDYQDPTDIRFVILTALIIGGFLIGIVLKYVLSDVFHKNPYGEQIVIDNFDTYFKNTPRDRKDAVFAGLYAAADTNTADVSKIPKKGAVIRGEPLQNNYNRDTNVHNNSFYVDIAALEQSYYVQFEWSDDASNINLSGYSVVVTCPTSDMMKYKDFKCQDIFTQEREEEEKITQEFPIINHLPIDIDYFDDKGAYISYRITNSLGSVDANGKYEYEIVITDRSGGNREAAITRLKSLKCGDKNCNPDDYKIKYIDESGGFGRAD